jgi:hypothetical protein
MLTEGAERWPRGLQNSLRGASYFEPRQYSNARDNHGKRRHSAALSEFEPRFLNGVQRSVNRKVQGSNPWSGANCKFEIRLDRCPLAVRL